jgi:hypothetical protein
MGRIAHNGVISDYRSIKLNRSLTIAPFLALRIDLEFRGYAIGLDQETINNRLQDGLFTPDFTRALQRSGDSTFTNTKVDLIGSTGPTESQTPESDQGISPGGISAAILGSLVIVATGVVYILYRQRKSIRKKGFIHQDGIIIETPASPNHSVMSPTSVYTTGVGSNIASRMARIVRSFSPRSGDDEEATKSADSSGSDTNDPMNDRLEQVGMLAKDDVISEEDDEKSASSDDVEAMAVHPYTGLIPPMIVIDCIERNDETDVQQLTTKSTTSKKKVKDIVPSLRLAATSDLVAALSDTTKPYDPDTLSSFIRNNSLVSNCEKEYQHQQFDANQNHEIRGGGSFNMFTSDDDDNEDEEDRQSTTESQTEDSDDLFDRLRRGCGSDGDETYRAGASRATELRSKHSFGLSLLTRPSRMTSDSSLRSSPKSVPSSPHTARDRACIDNQVSDDNTSKGHASKREAPSFLHSLWSKSPRHTRVSTTAKSDVSSLDSNTRRRKLHRRSSSRGSSGTNSDLEDEEGGASTNLLTFHAPKGKLGLVLECSTESTPIVAKVKDYSPLLDQVLPGDKIVMIDSTSTAKMGMHDVLSLLEGKTSRATSVRLQVHRDSRSSSSGLPYARSSPTISHLSLESLGTMSDQDNSPIHNQHKKSSSGSSNSYNNDNLLLASSQLASFTTMKRSQSGGGGGSSSTDIPPLAPSAPPSEIDGR